LLIKNILIKKKNLFFLKLLKNLIFL
jgi:hypothetical protein